MELTWVMKSAIGAVAFGAGVLLLLPPTQPKETWTSVHQSVPARVFVPSPAMEPEQPIYPVSYQPAQAEASPYTRPDRWDEATRNEATAREIRIAEDDRAYGDGYAWASENEVEDPRECRRLPEGKAGGCRDYVASLQPDRYELADLDEADRGF
jgi:hypothetical protein